MLSPAPFVDHTLLHPVTTAAQIHRLCEEAVEYGFAAVCIPPVYVPLAAERLYGSEVTVGTVVGFPLGYLPPLQKAAEAAAAVAAGAGEIDMVIHLGAVLEGRLEAVAEEIGQVVRAARGAEVKVIIECCYLQDAQKRELVECVVRGGAAFVKTSTGFGSSGATLADVELLVAAAAGRIRVKAAGGIRDWASCRAFLAAGAERIGTSAGVALVAGWRAAELPA
jgi:deoxyribose-phosphate aldolase